MTKPLTIGEAATAVGAWETKEGHVTFGSWMALEAFCIKLQSSLNAQTLSKQDTEVIKDSE